MVVTFIRHRSMRALLASVVVSSVAMAAGTPPQFEGKPLPIYPAKPTDCYVLLKNQWPYVQGGDYPVCRAVLDNLNKFCDEPPQYDARKIHPSTQALAQPEVVEALRRDSELKGHWNFAPRVFVPADLSNQLRQRISSLKWPDQSTCQMPEPTIMLLEEVLPWKYRSWNGTPFGGSCEGIDHSGFATIDVTTFESNQRGEPGERSASSSGSGTDFVLGSGKHRMAALVPSVNGRSQCTLWVWPR